MFFFRTDLRNLTRTAMLCLSFLHIFVWNTYFSSLPKDIEAARQIVLFELISIERKLWLTNPLCVDAKYKCPTLCGSICMGWMHLDVSLFCTMAYNFLVVPFSLFHYFSHFRSDPEKGAFYCFPKTDVTSYKFWLDDQITSSKLPVHFYRFN